MPKISIIIPAYNEEKYIGNFLNQLCKCFPSEEIIVVCNGCTDRTPEIVKGFRKKNVKSLVFKEKIGKGAAIVEGFKVAKGSYIGFVDADGSFGCKQIKNVIKVLENTDCAIASKWKGQRFSSVHWPFLRKFAGRFWNILVRFFLHLQLEDTQAGLKFVKKYVLDSIDMNFTCKGFEFDIEFLSKIRRKGFEIKEVYTPVKKRETTSFSFSHIPQMFLNLLRLSLRI
jgi:glycosyltransferase involved in cell wall biosynthesis